MDKIMYVVHSLDIGGTEKLIYDMVEEVVKRGIEPMVCCLDRLGIWGEDLKRKGFKIFNLKRKEGVDLGLVKRMRAVLKETSPDVLNPHQYSPYFYAMIAAFGLRHRPKIVFTEHGRFYPDRVRLKRVIFNQFANLFTDEIIGVSEFSKRALIKYEWFPEKKIKVIYNGINIEKYPAAIDVIAKKKSLGIAPEGKIIGAIGRLCAEKNYRMLIRAFSDISEQMEEARLVIAGGGELEGELKAYSNELGLTERIYFLGPRQDIPELLKVFDVLALSSDSEGASLVLLEAMASGLPIVATNAGGNPELVADGKTGILVPKGDHREFGGAVLNIFREPELQKKMGEAGRDLVKEKFTFDKMVDNYINIYEGLLRRT